MKSATRHLAIAITLSLFFISGNGFARQGDSSAHDNDRAYRSDHVIVKFHDNTTQTQARSTAKRHGSRLKRHFRNIARRKGANLALMEANGKNIKELIRELQSDPDVAFAEPDYIQYPDLIPNDPRFDQLWGLNNSNDADIDAPEAWDLMQSNAGSTVVIVIDTGIDYNHEDLADKMWTNPAEIADGVDNDGNGYIDDIYGYDAYDNDGDPMDSEGHGTHVSGTIAAAGNNAKGIAGVAWEDAWNVKLMGCRFLGPDGGYTSDAIDCLDYAVTMKERGVNIVASNNSWGGGGFSQTLLDAIESAADAGIIFIAAAGNDGENTDTSPHYPSSYTSDAIISVASTTSSDGLSSFSNYGATSVDLGAPGSNILSSISGGSFDPLRDSNIYYDNMESGSNGWSGSSSWAQVANGNNGGTAWSDSPSGNYDNYSDSTLTSPVINLAGAGTALQLGFYADYAIESGYDYLYVEISADGGSNWTSIGQLDGFSSGYEANSFSIPDAYLTASFRVRFRLVTDYSVTYDGVSIDDVAIGQAVTSTGYASWSGTSMATPHVTGVVALMMASNPDLSVSALKERILSSTDLISSLSGKTVTGGRLNAHKAIQLANGEVPPGPVEVFSDSFESGLGNWSQGSQSDWFNSTQRSTQGTRSAEVDGRASDAQLISKPIDLQGQNAATISFDWYIERGLDSGEYLAFDIDTGNGWTENARLRGNQDPENSWQHVELELNDISQLQLRFRASMSSSREDANVDNVVVTIVAGDPINQAPVVNAGLNRTITLPVDTVTLAGIVSDDGLPSGSLTTTWNQFSAPNDASVNFADANRVDTTATFSSDGVYQLQLTADDGELYTSKIVTITVEPAPVNQAPNVSAGSDQTITLPGGALLDGSVTDDGLPTSGTLSYQWSQVTGPGTVSFGNSNLIDTSATFSSAGTYTLKLSATDGAESASDTMTVVVNPIPPNNPPVCRIDSPTDNSTVIVKGESVNFTATVSDADAADTATITWTFTGGSPTSSSSEDPGNVTYANAGEYTATLTATDGEDSCSQQTRTITVNEPVNVAPEVNAGNDLSITLPTTQVSLDATVNDDGLPETSSLSTTWSSISGPADVSFANLAAVDTTATFSVAGTYVLRLTANDGSLETHDDLTVTVEAESAGPVEVFNDSFENGAWNGNWTEGSQGDWFTSSQRSTSGSRSAEVDGRANDAALISIPIDLQGRNDVSISFKWYIERGLDNGEYLAFDINTGNGWAQKAILAGNQSPENRWMNEQIDINNISQLQLRFRGNMSSSREDANLDEVRVVAE